MVLKFLEEEPMSGYSLMDKINEVTGSKPSSGSIYPLLEILTKEKIVDIKEVGKTKIYTLTKKGKLEFRQINKKKVEIIDKVSGLMQILGNVCDEHESEFFTQLQHHIKTGEIPFIHLEPELSELKSMLIKKSHTKNKYSKKIKSILKITTKEINELKWKNQSQ